jgi:hypothetical protein
MRIVIKASLEFADKAERHFVADAPISFRGFSWTVVDVTRPNGDGYDADSKPARITLKNWEPR